MTHAKKGAAIGRKSGALSRLAGEIRPLVDVSDWFQDVSVAYAAFVKNPPGAVLLDLSDGPEGKLALAGKIAESLPDTVLIAVSHDTSPELILKAFRAGVTDFIKWPAPSGEALSAIRRLFDSRRKKREEAQIYSLFSMKGGQGLTTIALNLADHVSRASGENTLLADMNLYGGDLGGRLKVSPSYTPFDLQRDMKRLDGDLLSSSLLRHERGFYLLPCADEISDAERIGGDEAGQMIRTLASHMDYLVIDLPHDLSPRTLAALQISTRILLVLQSDVESVKSALKVLRFFRESGHEEDRVCLVLNRRLKNGDLDSEDLEKVFDKPLFHVLPNDYRAVLESINMATTLDSVEARGSLNRAIRSLAEKLTGIPAPSPDGRLWKRLFAGYSLLRWTS
jgi:pilus assembly protein CpaE